jgi:NAD(P)-dependent dehydrogenase (short-subunit alcohol dehydrogenase family)
MAQKTIVLTGASDGIGAAAARRLGTNGHRLILVGRSPEKTVRVANEVGAEYFVADFSRLDDVEKLAHDILGTTDRIDVLANNAGGIFGDNAKTVDGFEKTFQINHLSPFLLTQLLTDTLIASRASVIQTSSAGARINGHLVLEDLEHAKDFTATRAYSTTKLDNILFTKELHRRYHDRGISSASFHPGSVATSFATESDSVLKHLYNNPIGRAFMISADKGAAQLVWLAEGTPGTDWASGTYYEKGKPARRNNPQASDATLARQLWDESERLLGRRLERTT